MLKTTSPSCGCGYCRHGPLNRIRCPACMKLKAAKSWGVPKGSAAFSRMMRATRETSLSAQPSRICQTNTAKDAHTATLFDKDRGTLSPEHDLESRTGPLQRQPPMRASHTSSDLKRATSIGSTNPNSWRFKSDSPGSRKTTSSSKTSAKPVIMRGWQLD